MIVQFTNQDDGSTVTTDKKVTLPRGVWSFSIGQSPKAPSDATPIEITITQADIDHLTQCRNDQLDA